MKAIATVFDRITDVTIAESQDDMIVSTTKLCTIIVLAPVIGLLYVMFVPFIGFVALGAALLSGVKPWLKL